MASTTVFDFGRTPDDVFYYAMELLEGGTLEDIVAVAGPQPRARVAQVLQRIAGALSEAHGIGLIHRDVKPANTWELEDARAWWERHGEAIKERRAVHEDIAGAQTIDIALQVLRS